MSACSRVIVAGFDHRLQHQVAPFQRALGMPVRGEIAWPLNQPGQHRRLGQREILDVLAEISPRRLAKAADGERTALSQVNLVGVELKDLLLGELLFQLKGNQNLDQLALDPLLGRQEEAARELHGDGRAALFVAARPQIDQRRFQQPPIIHSAVLKKTAILNRNDRVDQVLGKIVELYQLALGSLLALE